MTHYCKIYACLTLRTRYNCTFGWAVELQPADCGQAPGAVDWAAEPGCYVLHELTAAAAVPHPVFHGGHPVLESAASLTARAAAGHVGLPASQHQALL